MSILLILLKIIGILLLIILILLAFIVFHPIFYRVKGKVDEEMAAEGYFWWLFQILRLEFRVKNGERKLCIRIFGFPKKIGAAEEDVAEILDEPPQDDEDEFPKAKEEHLKREPKTEERREDSGKSISSEKAEDFKEAAPPKEKRFSKKEKSPVKKKRFSGWKEELTDERNHQALLHLWQEVLYLLAHLKPKDVKAEIDFSAGDPAVTGKITGALSLLPLLYKYDAHIYPDFTADHFYVKGWLFLKGHMALFHVFRSLFRLFRDKNIKRVYYKFRK